MAADTNPRASAQRAGKISLRGLTASLLAAKGTHMRERHDRYIPETRSDTQHMHRERTTTLPRAALSPARIAGAYIRTPIREGILVVTVHG